MLPTDDQLPPNQDNARMKGNKSSNAISMGFQHELHFPRQSPDNIAHITAEWWTPNTRKLAFPGTERGVRFMIQRALDSEAFISDVSGSQIIADVIAEMRENHHPELVATSNPIDPVINPAHYQLPGLGIEFLDVRKSLCSGIPEGTPYMAVTCWSEAITYMARMWKKNGLEDAKKAQFYIDRLIKELQQ